MFITKKHLSRRTLLRGAGAAIALPLAQSASLHLHVASAIEPIMRAISAENPVAPVEGPVPPAWLFTFAPLPPPQAAITSNIVAIRMPGDVPR